MRPVQFGLVFHYVFLPLNAQYVKTKVAYTDKKKQAFCGNLWSVQTTDIRRLHVFYKRYSRLKGVLTDAKLFMEIHQTGKVVSRYPTHFYIYQHLP